MNAAIVAVVVVGAAAQRESFKPGEAVTKGGGGR